ncbi:hypothetical protein LCGC14_1250060 [marine sediment metagenome]|uniref:Transglycosylase SLT domain-containing protein n=1 Tax=marine sediment metagenome TaxID=412755 RepID=A0A0F9L716_9ZZZZ
MKTWIGKHYAFLLCSALLMLACLICLSLLIRNNKQSEELALADNTSIDTEETSTSDVLEPEQLEIVEILIISEFDDLIKENASKYGFDWMLISAQIYAESSFKPEVTSVVGAMGLMQIMPSTSRWLGTNPELLVKPEVNIQLGCYYNRKIYIGIHNGVIEEEKLTLMLASYNAGPNRVKRLRKKYGDWDEIEPHLPSETRTYVTRIWNKYKEYLGLL